MKQKFNFLDIHAITNELKILEGSYIQNIYSLKKRFVVKFNTASLLIEPGVRMHLLESDEHDENLTHFAKKMRILRRSKLFKVEQVGLDRITHFEFNNLRMYVEFFSGGNIIITNTDNIIVMLLRTVPGLCEEGTLYLTNPVDLDFSVDSFTKLELRKMIPVDKIIIESIKRELEARVGNIDEFKDSINLRKKSVELGGTTDYDFGNGFIEGKRENIELGRTTNDATTNEDLNADITEDLNKVMNDATNEVMNVATNEVMNVATNEGTNEVINGLSKIKITQKKSIAGARKDSAAIISNNRDSGNQTDASRILDERINLYESYMAELKRKIENAKNFGMIIFKDEKMDTIIPLKIETSQKTIVFDSFNKACCEYFKEKVNTTSVVSKTESVKGKQKMRIEELELEIESSNKKANLLETSSLVDAIFEAFKSLRKNRAELTQFMKMDNSISKSIKSVNFDKNTAIINLENDLIEVKMDKNKHVNISSYYEKAKQIQEKIVKTKKAIKHIKIKEKNQPAIATTKRKPYWFEKFTFLILNRKIVLAGKNSQQNETLVKKHLNGLYFHCAVQGGSSVLLENSNEISFDDENRNINNNLESIMNGSIGVIENSTSLIDEFAEILIAASAALCLSKCWKSRVSQPVYYVNADQVSKSAPSGEFLTTGGFMIRGKKNEVNVYKLEWGIGILFRVESESGLNFRSTATSRIVHAMVVQGPWALLKNYKYKIKLIYGTNKKGQIMKDAQKIFLNESEGEEKEAIKRIHPDEYLNVIINDSKMAKVKK